MSKRIIIMLGLAVFCAAAAPAHAWWPRHPSGYGFVNDGACLPLGYFASGSHLGFGPGYPGLYAPPPVLYPYGWGPVIDYRSYYQRPTATLVILPGSPAWARAADAQPAAEPAAEAAESRDRTPRSLDWYVIYSTPRPAHR